MNIENLKLLEKDGKISCLKIEKDAIRYFDNNTKNYVVINLEKKEEIIENEICKHYSEGKCFFGDKCKNKHSYQDRNCSGNCWGSGKTYGVCTCDFEEKDICIHYKNGNCKFGKGCKKKHL